MRYVVMVHDVKVVLLLSLFDKRNEKGFSNLHLVTVICVHFTFMLIYFRFNQRILMGGDHLWS